MSRFAGLFWGDSVETVHDGLLFYLYFYRSWIDLELELMVDPQTVILLFSFLSPCLNPIPYEFFPLRR